MSQEVQTVWIDGAAGKIEALLHALDSPRGLILLAHPHPLYGGTMRNPVIFHADRALHRAGFTCLRLNFRGVGASAGVHDEGIGEVDDLCRAVEWLQCRTPEMALLLVGYSFGAICAIRCALQRPEVRGVIMIGLPVRVYAVPEIVELGRPFCVIQGSEDEFGSPSEVAPLLSQARPPGMLYPISGASHLFIEQTAEAASKVVEAAELLLHEL